MEYMNGFKISTETNILQSTLQMKIICYKIVECIP